MSCSRRTDTAGNRPRTRHTSPGEAAADALALDRLAEFLYRDPEAFPSGADTCEALDTALRQTGRDSCWLAARRGDELEQVGLPELAADVREGLAPEAALKRLLEVGEAGSSAAYLVEGWIA